jgi:acyl dehydratase
MTIADLRQRIGARVRDDVPPYVWDCSVDTVRNFARGYGDDNPLYSDPEYARTGPRRGLVAPPLFPIAAGLPVAVDSDSDTIDLELVARGMQQAIGADRWTLCRPIGEGVRLARERHLVAGEEIEGGIELVVRTSYRAESMVYAVHDRVRHYLRGDAEHAEGPVELAHYGDADIDAIAAAYEAEQRRGAEPRWVGDVRAGNVVGPLLKGPMTITDLVAYRGGVGPGPLGGEPHRLAFENRRRRPGLYDGDTSGAPDITERRHYDEHYARRLGYPTAYDYSHTRVTWLSHLLTDWMGDGGWLWRLDATVDAENYVGDTHTLSGAVSSVTMDQGFGRVEVAVEGRNQRNEQTCHGTAVVLLPAEPATVVSDTQIASLPL